MLHSEPDLHGQLILSLAGVHHIDSAGIGLLARVVTACVKHGTALKVVLPGGVPEEALRRVRIFDGWPRFWGEAAAIQAAQADAPGA